MRILIGVFSFCLFVILFSCEEHGFLVECAECKIEEPKNAELEIQLSKPDQNMAGAKIDIYEGNLEDNILLDSFYEKTEQHNACSLFCFNK